MFDCGQNRGAPCAYSFAMHRVDPVAHEPLTPRALMPSRGGAMLAALALIGLASTAAQGAMPGEGFSSAICGGRGFVTLPFNLPGQPPGPRRECPTGCHALCSRKTPTGFEGDIDDD